MEADASEYRRESQAGAAAAFETAVQQGAERAVRRWGYTNPADVAAYALLSAEGGDTTFASVRGRARAIGPSLITGGESTLTSGVKIRDTSGAYEFLSQQITFAALGAVAGEVLGALTSGATAGVASAETALSTVRLTAPGETFIRYESANTAFSRVTPAGGVTPNTFAAPLSEGVIPLGERAAVYNLPSPEIPRTSLYVLRPPGGTPVIGPRPVVGGTGNEVVFPVGFGR